MIDFGFGYGVGRKIVDVVQIAALLLVCLAIVAAVTLGWVSLMESGASRARCEDVCAEHGMWDVVKPADGALRCTCLAIDGIDGQ